MVSFVVDFVVVDFVVVMLMAVVRRVTDPNTCMRAPRHVKEAIELE